MTGGRVSKVGVGCGGVVSCWLVFILVGGSVVTTLVGRLGCVSET